MVNGIPCLNVRLKRLELKNFRGFRNASLSFDANKKAVLIIADNGLGKSSLLDVIAEFLRYSRHVAIYKVHDISKIYRSGLNSAFDVTNGTFNSTCFAGFEITYPNPKLEFLEWLQDCVDWINEIEAHGNIAYLILDEEEMAYVISTKDVTTSGEDAKFYDYLLPEHLEQKESLIKEFLDRYVNNELQFSKKNSEERWELDTTFYGVLFPDSFKGEISFMFEMNSFSADSIQFKNLEPSPGNVSNLINELKKGRAFIEGFQKAVQRRYPYEIMSDSEVALPMLVYYKGESTNIKLNEKIKLPYRARWFQPYFQSLEPNNFNFSDFLSWALFTIDEAPYHWELLKTIVCEILNSQDSDNQYIDFKIKAAELILVKSVAKGERQEIKIPQLSSGEKCVVTLIIDLVKRAIQLNPQLLPKKLIDFKDFEFQTPGIVLIDEVDLHLHPKWQQKIVPNLLKKFPYIQFIITTHSPFVLQNVKNEEANIVSIIDFSQVQKIEDNRSYGRDLSHVLYSLMGVSKRRPIDVQNQIDQVYDEIDKGHLEDAKKSLDKLIELLTDKDDEVINLQTLIEFKQL